MLLGAACSGGGTAQTGSSFVGKSTAQAGVAKLSFIFFLMEGSHYLEGRTCSSEHVSLKYTELLLARRWAVGLLCVRLLRGPKKCFLQNANISIINPLRLLM